MTPQEDKDEITTRDEFALAAMNAYILKYNIGPTTESSIARQAYKMADKMLEARREGKKS